MASEFGFELCLRPLPIPYHVCLICSKLKYSWKGNVGSIKYGRLVIWITLYNGGFICDWGGWPDLEEGTVSAALNSMIYAFDQGVSFLPDIHFHFWLTSSSIVRNRYLDAYAYNITPFSVFVGWVLSRYSHFGNSCATRLIAVQNSRKSKKSKIV